jgi:hypothetical protein
MNAIDNLRLPTALIGFLTLRVIAWFEMWGMAMMFAGNLILAIAGLAYWD